MKNTVRVLLFLLILTGAIFIFRENLESELFRIFSLIITFSVFFIGLVIFLENRHPTQTITWLVVLGSFPLLGFIFYILFGRNYKKERIFRKKYFLDKQAFLTVEGEANEIPANRQSKYAGQQQKLVTLAQRLGNSPISFTTETKTLANGSETFEHILQELKKAKHHIHLEYYIVRDDEIGKEIKSILCRKARDGVEVRFMFDAVGSWQLSKKYVADLRKAGVEAVPFGPVKLPFLNNKFNFRNHRKIIVIDGMTGFVGGLNIGDEYLGRNKKIGFWRDTHLMLKGDAVRSLQLIFLQDWYYMTNKSLLTEEYFPHVPAGRDLGGVQLIAGGPDNEWTAIKKIFFSMITSAQKSVWIASPYFIPDEDIKSALQIAALSGIDVRILMPNKPDKRIVFHASRSYFPDLLEAGVKIYEYQHGFMHSKIVIVDSELASIGTSNMDMRSFHLNFEVNAFLYRTESTRKLVNEYVNDIKDSKRLELESFGKRHIGYRLLESTSRLMSPLL
ncbi:cardiolipin synthase [Neobacillus notoginsengisoli]|uniref:Cardiolipin synthase n=1 Tax=Neobacillus notoginsengisoli TaxID=1578198 RepID=A0A417YZL0_9BACI|nr:cardiolipin synthase [Neobacillus notoginsengisoli]RHW43226.1 cardiolipin synthase [Neobacillus notoginsengisoli]